MVQTLRIDMRSSMGRNEILGGWQGLSREMKRFFSEAKVHGASVLLKQMEDLKKVQDRDHNSSDLAFDRVTGKWTSLVHRTSQSILINESNANRTQMEGQIIREKSEGEIKTSTTLNGVPNETTHQIVSSAVDVCAEQGNDVATTSGISTMLDGVSNVTSNKIVSMDIDKDEDISVATKSATTSEIVPTEEKILSPRKAFSTSFNPYSRIISKSSESVTGSTLSRTDGDLGSSTVIPLSLDVEPPNSSPVVAPHRVHVPTASASQSSRGMQDNHLCVICLERDKNILLLPCKHLCLCGKCFHVNNLTECPICRKTIASHLDVFT